MCNVLPIDCGGSVCLCFVMHYFVAILVLQSSGRGRGSWLLCFYFLQMSCNYKYHVSLFHGAMGWSAVCDCGIS